VFFNGVCFHLSMLFPFVHGVCFHLSHLSHIWEVVKAHVAISPKYPETVHYRGEGVFMISGRNISRRSQFKAQNL